MLPFSEQQQKHGISFRLKCIMGQKGIVFPHQNFLLICFHLQSIQKRDWIQWPFRLEVT